MTTFSISEIDSRVESLPLPSSVRDDLRLLLEQAGRAVDRGAAPTARQFLEQFGDRIGEQPANVVPASVATDLARRARFLTEALDSGLALGGAQVGPDGAVLRIADPNSPLLGAELTIPSGALTGQIFVSLSTSDAIPPNRVLTFGGTGLVVGPAGLDFLRPATLVLPYLDADDDGVVDGTGLTERIVKVGVIDAGGRIAFPRRTLDPDAHLQSVQIYELATYWTVLWRLAPGVLTYKLVWPSSGIPIEDGFDLAALGAAVRSAISVWAPAMAQAGLSFQEVAEAQPAAVRFGFFSTDTPLSVLDSSGSTPVSDLLPGLSRGLGDGVVQVYARTNPLTAGEGFAVTFNSDFGSSAEAPGLVWSPGHSGDGSAVSIEAVAVHGMGHVLGLDDLANAVQPPVMATGADLLRPAVCPALEDIEAFRALYGVPLSDPLPACPHAGIGGLPAEFDFETVEMGAPASNTFTVRNAGTGDLLIGSIETEGDADSGFSVDSSRTLDVLGPGDSTSFTVLFAPEAPGRHSDRVRISSNSPGSPVVIDLWGAGPYGEPGCTLTSAPARITRGETASLKWTTTNLPQTASISGLGFVDPGQTRIDVSPGITTGYTLTVTNAAGVGSCDLTLEVIPASSSDVVWTKQIGTPGEDAIRSVDAGARGIFLAGEVDGGTDTLGSAYLGRYDTAGDPLWEREFDESRIEALAVDDSGVYVAGLTARGLGEETYAGGLDVFVRKYDLDGVIQWTRQFGTGAIDRASSIAVDLSGVYVAGVTGDRLEGQTAAGGLDVFLARYDLDGEFLWLEQFGTPVDDFARDIEVVPDGLVVVGDTGTALAGQVASGGSDAFLIRYTTDGERDWVRQFGGTGSDFIAAVAADETGLYVGGATETALSGQTSQGGFDAFLRKYSFDGTELWTRQFGTPQTDSIAALGADATGIYVAGVTDGALGGAGFGGFDAFVRAYDSSGDEIWTRHVGTTGVDDGFATSPYHIGVYVVGSTLGTLEDGVNEGSTDGYVVKILK